MRPPLYPFAAPLFLKAFDPSIKIGATKTLTASRLMLLALARGLALADTGAAAAPPATRPSAQSLADSPASTIAVNSANAEPGAPIGRAKSGKPESEKTYSPFHINSAHRRKSVSGDHAV